MGGGGKYDLAQPDVYLIALNAAISALRRRHRRPVGLVANTYDPKLTVALAHRPFI